MKKVTFYILSLSVLLSLNKLSAQQNSLFNTYSLDPLQLNIAYAGAVCSEANIHYRTQWIGMQNAPKLLQLNGHATLGKSNALALKINSQSQGLLNTLGANIGYCYLVKVSNTAKVHLGLGLGWSQATLNAQKANVIQANDVTLNSNNSQIANGFDSEFGAMFVGNKLKAGVSALHLYNSNPNFSGNSSFKLHPQINSQISYIFNKNKKIEIEPWLLSRYTLEGNHTIEGLINFNFIKTITFGLGYRSNYGILALFGAKIGDIKLGYSFDYVASRNAINLGASHQIVLGFSMCKTAKTKKPIEEPVDVVTAPTNTLLPTVIESVEKPAEKPIAEPAENNITNNVVEEQKIEPTINEILSEINVIAEEVVFDINKSKLNDDGLKKLEDVAKVMINNKNLKINIIGHACSKGSKETNELLSIRRATYVREKLIKLGVNPENINRSIGVGAEEELFDNNSVNQPKNRTVRFVSVP